MHSGHVYTLGLGPYSEYKHHSKQIDISIVFNLVAVDGLFCHLLLYCIHMQKLVQRSLKEQEKLQHMLENLPSGMRKDVFAAQLEQSSSRYFLNTVKSFVSTLIWQ